MASHWGTLANLGTHFGHLRLHWGVLELPWGCFGDDFGLFWASSEKKLSVGTPPQADGSQVPRLRTKIDSLELADRSRRSRRSRRNGPRTTVQTLRSTRAGGQDDVSFTNSLKLIISLQHTESQQKKSALVLVGDPAHKHVPGSPR